MKRKYSLLLLLVFVGTNAQAQKIQPINLYPQSVDWQIDTSSQESFSGSHEYRAPNFESSWWDEMPTLRLDDEFRCGLNVFSGKMNCRKKF